MSEPRRDGSGVDRRTFLVQGAGALAAGLVPGVLPGGGILADEPAAAFKLPPLPYPPEALEPAIDKTTMEIHHGKHHAAYVANLNKALAGKPDLASRSVEELVRGLSRLPEDVRTAVKNQGGGHLNHSLFWPSLKPHGGGEPTGELADAVRSTFGGFEKLKESFSEAATKVFGSGWAWLVRREGKLEVTSTPNQENPLTNGATPLLGLDVWEHAYYLKYQNRRPEYIAAFWTIVNWEEVARRFQAGKPVVL